LEGIADRRVEKHGVERSLEATFTVGQLKELWSSSAITSRDGCVKALLFLIEFVWCQSWYTAHVSSVPGGRDAGQHRSPSVSVTFGYRPNLANGICDPAPPRGTVTG
jgi:hypothetical protein